MLPARYNTLVIMENQTEQMIALMEEKLKGTEEKKLRFFRLDELKRNIRRSSIYEHDCEVCRLFIPETEATVNHIGEAVNVPGKERRELDRLIFRLSNHMMKEHGFFPRYHFSYRWSIVGIFSGLILGYLLFRLFPDHGLIFAAVALIAGLFTGQILGRRLDLKIKDQGKVM